jgi:SAM-dependent methyltransferase
MLQLVAIIALAVVLGKESLTPGNSWSPYYKVFVAKIYHQPGLVAGLNVNGIPHQLIYAVEATRETPYAAPYKYAGSSAPGNVLVIGAGTGNDVALALAQGATHVDAVEIDPRIQQVGEEMHPNSPYKDPRVDVHIDDGRAFLQRTQQRYDLILFALPDSLTLVSGQSSLRLESYLFTVQAFQQARHHLKSNGVFAMYNFYREQWLVDRLANTLRVVYGHSPCVDNIETLGTLAVLAISIDPSRIHCATAWSGNSRDVPAPATDDRPFLYLRHPSIPSFYVVTIALILLASTLIVRFTAGATVATLTGYVDLFFMGSAFLLLETKNVVQFALLFGTTWFVNALVFAGILLAVLAAVELTRRLRVARPEVLYPLLFISLFVAWIVPTSALLALSPSARFIAATLLAFSPIFLANVVFAQRFKDVGASAVAFGMNLLGAIVGGVLEYGSLIVGYRTLLIVTGILYGFAFVFWKRVPKDRRGWENHVGREVHPVVPTS